MFNVYVKFISLFKKIIVFILILIHYNNLLKKIYLFVNNEYDFKTEIYDKNGNEKQWI